MSRNTDASFPYFDAFTTCASLLSQWLLSHKKLLNWTLWIIVDIVAMFIYEQKGLYPTAWLYFCFLIMALIVKAASEVPEPSTLAILVLGLMGLASRRCMKKS